MKLIEDYINANPIQTKPPLKLQVLTFAEGVDGPFIQILSEPTSALLSTLFTRFALHSGQKSDVRSQITSITSLHFHSFADAFGFPSLTKMDRFASLQSGRRVVYCNARVARGTFVQGQLNLIIVI